MTDLTVAERSANILADGGDKAILNAENKLPGVIRSQRLSRTEKIIRIRDIGKTIGAIVAPMTICRRGCSQCCHQHVFISELEAKVIASESGRRRRDVLAGRFVTDEAAQRKWLGVPCTFLKDGDCSIYEHRPLACRTHFSMENDPAKCHTSRGMVSDINLFDSGSTTFALAAITLRTNHADIREFFPE